MTCEYERVISETASITAFNKAVSSALNELEDEISRLADQRDALQRGIESLQLAHSNNPKRIKK